MHTYSFIFHLYPDRRVPSNVFLPWIMWCSAVTNIHIKASSHWVNAFANLFLYSRSTCKEAFVSIIIFNALDCVMQTLGVNAPNLRCSSISDFFIYIYNAAHASSVLHHLSLVFFVIFYSLQKCPRWFFREVRSWINMKGTILFLMLRAHRRARAWICTFLSMHAWKLGAAPNGSAHACMYFHAHARWCEWGIRPGPRVPNFIIPYTIKMIIQLKVLCPFCKTFTRK